MYNYALYYPTIEFVDYEWLWRASLIWDRIYRIVPDGYQPEDPPNIEALCESGEIGVPIDPGGYRVEVAREFMERFNSGEWDAAALIEEEPNHYARLHKDKVDVALSEMLIAKGSVERGEWLEVPSILEAHYMTYLANHIAERGSLQMVSDNVPAWTGATYFRMDGGVEDHPDEDQTQHLATLVMKRFLPDSVISMPPREITSFREKYREERQRFVSAIQQAAETLARCDDPSIVNDMIADLQKQIDSALSDFRGSLSTLTVGALSGAYSLAFPILAEVATNFGGASLDLGSLMALGSAQGAAIGLVAGLANHQDGKRRLARECDYSYLMHVRKEWRGVNMGNQDYNYYLYRKMEEFIND